MMSRNLQSFRERAARAAAKVYSKEMKIVEIVPSKRVKILEERYGRRSTMITSQLPVDRWHEIIGDPTYADANLDRLVHNAHRIELAGESMRRTRGKQNQKA